MKSSKEMFESVQKKAHEIEVRKRKQAKRIATCVVSLVLVVGITVGVCVPLLSANGGYTPMSEGDQPDSPYYPGPPSPPSDTHLYKVAYAETYRNDEIPFNVSYIKTDIEANLAMKLDSLPALMWFCEENNLPFFDESDSNYDSKLSETIRTYDDDFFDDNSMVLVFSIDKDYPTARIDDVCIEGKILNIVFAKTNPIYEFSQQNTFVYIIELNKKKTERINDIRIDYISNGTFYLLESAYDEGLISDEVIKSLAYYNNNGKEYVIGEGFKDTDYIPISKSPEKISDNTQLKIKQTYMDYMYYLGIVGIEESDLVITDYFGTYNDFVAVKISQATSLQYVKTSGTSTIADTVFYYTDCNSPIMLWKK